MNEIKKLHPVEALTPEQRDALRLVGRGYKSKEIGRMLGISHYAANRRIDRGVEKLEAANRFDAGRMVVDFESQMCDAVAPSGDSLHFPDRVISGDLGVPDEARSAGFPWPFATSRRRDGLSIKQRLAWAVIGIPCFVMLSWGALLSGVAALDTLKL